jgi:RNA polymerase sigma-70 factor, ECF subfamily
MDPFKEKKHELFLVLRAQTGDRAAFDELFIAVQSRFFRYIRHLVGDRELAEDILQEVFLIVYRKIKWLDDPKLFRAWTYRIASREAFRHIKNKRLRPSTDEDVFATIPVEEPDELFDKELLDRLPELVARLSPESRTAIVLHYLDEFSLRETAEILDISVGTAKSRVAYGLKVLRRLIRNGAKVYER